MLGGMLLAQRIVPPAPWTVTAADPQGASWNLPPGTAVSTSAGAWLVTGGTSAVLVIPVPSYWAYTVTVMGANDAGTDHGIELSSGGSGGAVVSGYAPWTVTLITRDAINTTGNVGGTTSVTVQIYAADVHPLNFRVTSITVTASETV